jgi:hypothetical protein
VPIWWISILSVWKFSDKLLPRSQSYNHRIYNCNTSVAISWSFEKVEQNIEL